MKQMTLFGEPESVEDRPKSKAKPAKPKHQARVKGAKATLLAVFSRSRVPLTANEAAELASNAEPSKQAKMVETYRKRCRELVRDGKLVESIKRPCSVTGESVATFKGADDG